MRTYKRHLQLLIWLCLMERAISAPLGGEAQIFFDGGEQSFVQTVDSTAVPKLHFNLTFDDIDLVKDRPAAALDSVFPFEFTNFNIYNIAAAVKHGLLAANDSTCAVHGPNAIFTSQSEHFSPSRFDLDPKIHRQYNVSDYVDFVGWHVKPVGPVPERGLAEIRAWRMHRGIPQHVYTGGVVWPAGGWLTPIRGDLGIFFPGWGKDVNMFEISAREAVSGKPVPICIGRIEVYLKG